MVHIHVHTYIHRFLYTNFFYYSKFLPPGSLRIGHTVKGSVPKDIKILSFKTPSKYFVIVILNKWVKHWWGCNLINDKISIYIDDNNLFLQNIYWRNMPVCCFFLECLLFTKSRRTSNDLNSGIILWD